MQTDATENQGYHSYTIASFARWAKIYDAFATLLRIKDVRRQTVEISRVQPGDKVLDVCTGTGDVALAFARQCDNVTGIDLSPDMLAVAQKKDTESKIRFVQMDATRMDFDDGEFDVSSISFGLHDMPPDAREKVLQEMARATRRWIVIADYNPPQNPILRAFYVALISLYESKYFPGFARSDFEGLLTCCGLEVAVQKPTYGGLVSIWLTSPNC